MEVIEKFMAEREYVQKLIYLIVNNIVNEGLLPNNFFRRPGDERDLECVCDNPKCKLKKMQRK